MIQKLWHKFKSWLKGFRKVEPTNGFKVPEVPRTYVYTEDVLLNSLLLKKLGIAQNLQYGDWYFIKHEDSILTKIYHKDGADNMEDFDFLSKGNYVRIIGQDEGLNLLNSLGYTYPKTNAATIYENGIRNAKFEHYLQGTGISVSSFTMHGCILRAACIAVQISKMQSEIIPELRNLGLNPKETENES